MKIKKKYCEWSSIRLKAFTLMECLVTLVIISGSVLLFQGLSQILSNDIKQLTVSNREEWLLFCEQLTYELDKSEFVKIDDQKMYVRQNGKPIAFGKSKKDDFRKTAADGRGYQPMLYQVAKTNITKEAEDRVKLTIVFTNQLERTFIYAFQKER